MKCKLHCPHLSSQVCRWAAVRSPIVQLRGDHTQTIFWVPAVSFGIEDVPRVVRTLLQAHGADHPFIISEG
jgi:hypothetical protein